jgi:hypothetical protein
LSAVSDLKKRLSDDKHFVDLYRSSNQINVIDQKKDIFSASRERQYSKAHHKN